MSLPTRAFVGLGGNLGDVVQAFERTFLAIAKLPKTRLLARSSFYRTPAWGMTDQPEFINAVAELTTTLSPQALLAGLLEIECHAGRDRAGARRWGPRTLDLDLLLYGDTCMDEPGLRIPHPLMHERGFVLVPLLEIAPDVVIPGIGPARECAVQVVSDDIQALP